MREIGSEFWEVPTVEENNGLFPESTQWYLSGRSALQAIVTELGEASSISMPSWCCDSVVKAFVNVGYDVCFYPVYYDRGLVQELRFDTDVLFLMDYFGYTGPKHDLRGYKGVVIRDVTHSLFTTNYSDAKYYFGSLRKWCGVWTGGYAWSQDGNRLVVGTSDDYGYAKKREQAMLKKNEYINGVSDDKGYLGVFEQAEDGLDRVGIAPAVDRDVRISQKIDVEGIKEIRRNNSEILRTAFPEWLIFSQLSPTDTPMFVPILVPDGKRDEMRRYLIQNEIYCPVHWPVSKYHKLNEKEKYIYENELSLVCDQRYTENDMNRIVETVNEFMRRK